MINQWVDEYGISLSTDDLPDVQMGMVGDEWHGPKPPGQGWVAIAPGPRGGKRWKKSGQAVAPQQSAPSKSGKQSTKIDSATIDSKIKAAHAAATCSVGKGRGKCGEVSVELWRELGFPKNLVPYGVSLTKDTDTKGRDHIVLYDQSTGRVVDPTGYQYNNPTHTTKDATPYLDWSPLRSDEIKQVMKDSALAKRTAGDISLEEYKATVNNIEQQATLKQPTTPKMPKAVKPVPANPKQVLGLVQSAMKQVTPDNVKAAIDGLMGLKLAEMRQVMSAVGATGKGRGKSDLAKAVQKHIEKQVTSTSAASQQDDKQNTIRSKEFKSWFGDWESDPANASKVVDRKTGEPKETHDIKRVFHGTKVKFDKFDKSKIAEYGLKVGKGFYFAENRQIADDYANGAVGTTTEGKAGDGDVYECYLNVRKPFDLHGTMTRKQVNDVISAMVKVQGGKGFRDVYGIGQNDTRKMLEHNIDRLAGNGFDGTNTGDNDAFSSFHVYNALERYINDDHNLNEAFQALGYDGITYTAGVSTGGPAINEEQMKKGFGRCWVVFEPNQVKSANNKGSFDPSNENIMMGES